MQADTMQRVDIVTDGGQIMRVSFGVLFMRTTLKQSINHSINQ
jgi:hypothetical protein